MKKPIIARNILTTAATDSNDKIDELRLENKFSLSHLDTPANCISGGLSKVLLSCITFPPSSFFYCSN
jgi:hypothetical protein